MDGFTFQTILNCVYSTTTAFCRKFKSKVYFYLRKQTAITYLIKIENLDIILIFQETIKLIYFYFEENQLKCKQILSFPIDSETNKILSYVEINNN